ncbi:MAG TPA: ATP-binding protein [Syntrophales bacterium]|nr:HAMP domain-containing protein [Syntrophobacterales bacterium]HQL91109.1 ATP-binding protein [Syntrophales bacterium]
MKGRLFFKIFATYLAIAVLAIGIVGFLAGNQIKAKLERQVENELMAYAGIVDLYPMKEIQPRAEEIARIARARVTVIDREGTVIAETDRDAATLGSHLERPEIQEARVRGKGSAIRYSRSMKEDMMYVALPIQKGQEIAGYIRLSRSLGDVKKSVDEFTGILLQSFVIVLISSILVAYVFSRRLTTPIRDMEQFTERLRMGEAPGTLLIRTSDEIGVLAENINFIVEELSKRIGALQEEKAKVEAAFSSALDGVLLLDHGGRIETVNQGLWTMIGNRYRDIVGKTPLEAFRNLDLQKALDKYRTHGMPVSQEIELGEEDPLVLDASITPVRGIDAAEGKTMIVFHDVTRLKKLERMRVDFVANVTHEIKTPLTAILGFVETLQEGAIEDRDTAKKFLTTIARHAERLNRLVEDLLTISNIELGEMRFCFESVSLSGIAESVLNVIQLKAAGKRIDIATQIPEGLSPIRADRDRLSQILLNVLDNAVKFTPEGGKVTLAAEPFAGGEVVVRISDTGIGVPRDEIGRLGERFYRVDKTRSRELGGTGLGLSIVKHLMAAHRGRLEIESHLGHGTTVSLYFPVAKDPAG